MTLKINRSRWNLFRKGVLPVVTIFMIAALLLVIVWPSAASALDQQLLLENQSPAYYKLVSGKVRKQVLSSVAEDGTDNLVVNHLSSFSGEQGFIVTVNADGSFTFSGSNHTDNPVYLQITPDHWKLPGGTYTLSDAGGGQEPSGDGIFMFLQNRVYQIGGMTASPVTYDLRGGTQRILIAPEDQTDYFLNLCITPGFSSEGVTFYPMITRESTSDLYLPCVVDITPEMNVPSVAYDIFYTTKSEFCRMTDSDVKKLDHFIRFQTSGQWETIDFQDGTGLVFTRDASGGIDTDHPVYGELDETGRIKNALGGIQNIGEEDKSFHEISVFADYLSKLQEYKYTILIAVQDDGFSAIDENAAQALHALGVKTKISEDLYRYSYYAVLAPGGDAAEEVSEQELNYTGNLPDGTACQITSRGMLAGDPVASIRINGQEWSMSRRGMNIVIYDQVQHKVVDTVCFDTCSGLYAYRPTVLPEQ